MKPEWPLYGLGVAMTTVVIAASELFGWSDQTRNTVVGVGIAVLLFTYLPRTERRNDRDKAATR